jgi:DNA-directed RNA polymerase subunit M/transcription elongation factor TFIIS
MNICQACQKQTDLFMLTTHQDKEVKVCPECFKLRQEADELQERIKSKWIDFKENMLKHYADSDAARGPGLNIANSYNCVSCGNMAGVASISKKGDEWETIYICYECDILDQFKSWLHRALV